MEISQIPEEKEAILSCGSLFETQLLRLLYDDLGLQGQCNALTARVRSLEDHLANKITMTIPKTVT